MEKAKINSYQLFILIVLFETGSSIVISLGINAKQDAWLAILTGLVGGLLLFLVYHKLYQYYPNMLPTKYMKQIVGRFLGTILGVIYVVYFMYIAARVLRDFGELLLTFAYTETPLLIINALMVLTIVYGVRKGIEVLARTGELLFIFLYILAVSGFILVFITGSVNFNNLKPVLEDGIKPILKVAGTETLYVPFGEMIALTMILPYLKDSSKAKKIGLTAISLSGINLAITMAFNVAVLGVDINQRSPFPLLSTIQMIRIEHFLERQDIFFMLALVIGCFFKISLYFYVSVVGVTDLFKLEDFKKVVYPLGVMLLLISMLIASNFPEHILEGLKYVPIFLHIPLQVIFPLFLFTIAFVKNRKKKKRGSV